MCAHLEFPMVSNLEQEGLKRPNRELASLFLFPILLRGLSDVQMRPTKTAAYYISPIEIGLLWAKITHIKSHSKALGFVHQTDMK